MKLFHGTSTKYLDAILKDGIQPRNATGIDTLERFEGGADLLSAPNHVYLSRNSARYAISTPFAEDAPGDEPFSPNAQMEFAPMLVEVDSGKLSESNFRPDEDWLATVMIGLNCHLHGSEVDLSTPEGLTLMRKVQARICGDMSLNAHLWETCLEYSGCLAHFGAIPPTAIERVSILPLSYIQFAELGLLTEGNSMNLPPETIERMNNAVLKWMTGYSTSIDDWAPASARLPKRLRRRIMDLTKVRPRFIYPNRA